MTYIEPTDIYMGGIDAVMEKARANFANGEYRWLVNVLDKIIWVEPGHVEARQLAAAAHNQLGYAAENAIWRNAYLSAAQELRNGLPEGDKNHRLLRDVLRGMSAVYLLNSLSIRLNGPMANGLGFSINWSMTDADEYCHTELTNSVLVNREGQGPNAATTVSLARETLSELALGVIGLDGLKAQNVVVSGDDRALSTLIDMLDQFSPWIPIATHDLKQHEQELLTGK